MKKILKEFGTNKNIFFQVGMPGIYVLNFRAFTLRVFEIFAVQTNKRKTII